MKCDRCGAKTNRKKHFRGYFIGVVKGIYCDDCTTLLRSLDWLKYAEDGILNTVSGLCGVRHDNADTLLTKTFSLRNDAEKMRDDIQNMFDNHIESDEEQP